jgi:CheY-like chemotaxis protein
MRRACSLPGVRTGRDDGCITGRGAVFCGLVIDCIWDRTLRLTAGSDLLAAIAIIMATVGGAAVSTLLKDERLFGWYAIGLVMSFLASLAGGLTTLRKEMANDGLASCIAQEERSLPMIQARNQDDHELVNSMYTHRSNTMKIMVADHDRDLVDLLSFWLKSQGYDVVRAFDGEQAIQRWHEAWPDLVLLDLHLPKCDGFAVCQQMRSETPATALILTGSACEEDEVRGLELGADDYLRKPLSPRRLLACIQTLLHQ